MLPTFSIYFEYRNINNHSETIGHFITKTREDGVLFIKRSYDNYNFVREYSRDIHPRTIYSDMICEGMPMWERTRIFVNCGEHGQFYTDNRNITYNQTVDWLLQILREIDNERVNAHHPYYQHLIYKSRCDTLSEEVVW
jgi:hypothetical protein